MRYSDDSEAEVRSRSSWLMKPAVSPAASPTSLIVSPSSRRRARSREPTLSSVWGAVVTM
jgi:hypothetical protein